MDVFSVGGGALLHRLCMVFQRMCVYCLWSQCASTCSVHRFCLYVCMSEVISSFKSLRAGSQVFALLMLFLCVIVHTWYPSFVMFFAHLKVTSLWIPIILVCSVYLNPPWQSSPSVACVGMSWSSWFLRPELFFSSGKLFSMCWIHLLDVQWCTNPLGSSDLGISSIHQLVGLHNPVWLYAVWSSSTYYLTCLIFFEH